MISWAKRRRERIERRRRGPLPETPLPDEDLMYIEHRMHVHDGMSPAWRALVHYFGYEPVSALYTSGSYDPVMAWHILDERRDNRQKEQLSTDYHLRR